METVNIREAQTQLSRLLERVCAGEEIVIVKSGDPIARLVPFTPVKAARQPGALKGKIRLDDSFFDPLPAGELTHWEAR